MARRDDKQKAIELRKSGESYGQIKNLIKVSKGTLSLWLRNYPLSEKRIRELRDKNPRRIERYIKTCRERKEKLLKQIYNNEKNEILPFSKRDLFVAGLFLYWGEGGKTQEAQLCLSNTNPTIIKFFIYWLENSLNVKRGVIKIKLHLYKNMSVEEEIKFWAKILNIKSSQFTKPYIKITDSRAITYKNGFGHGTCNAIVHNVIFGRKVLMGLKTIEDYFDVKYK